MIAALLALAALQPGPPRPPELAHFGRPETQAVRSTVTCSAHTMSIDILVTRGAVKLRRPATYPGKRYHDAFSELDAALFNIREYKDLGATCFGGDPYFILRGYSGITGKLTTITIASYEGKISGFKVAAAPD